MNITVSEKRQKPGSHSRSAYLKPGNYTCGMKHKLKRSITSLCSGFPDVVCFADSGLCVSGILHKPEAFNCNNKVQTFTG